MNRLGRLVLLSFSIGLSVGAGASCCGDKVVYPVEDGQYRPSGLDDWSSAILTTDRERETVTVDYEGLDGASYRVTYRITGFGEDYY